MKKFIIPLLIIAFIITGAVGWSAINNPVEVKIKNNNTIVSKPTISSSEIQTTTLPTTAPSMMPQTTITYANPSVVIDAIETSVPDKNWPDLLPFLTDKVYLIKYGSSCCGSITKSQALSELTYLNGAVKPWNFSDTNPIAQKLETNDPEQFKDMWIGISANYYAVGFKWNSEFLIDKITIVGDYRLITGN